MNFHLQKKRLFLIMITLLSWFTTSIINLTYAQERDFIEQFNQFKEIIEIETLDQLNDLKVLYFCVDQNQKELPLYINKSEKYNILDRSVVLNAFDLQEYENDQEYQMIQKCMETSKTIYTTKENQEFFSQWEKHIDYCNNFEEKQNNSNFLKEQKNNSITDKENELNYLKSKFNLNHKLISILRLISFVSLIAFVFFVFKLKQND